MLLLCLLPLVGLAWAGYSHQAAPVVGGGGYSTAQQPGFVGNNYGGIATIPGGGAVGGDFNPALLGGQRGYPGIRARLNSRAFQYASSIVGDLLNNEIKKARIPPISQCVPQVNGCIQIYNLYVSRYRCPQRVVLYPAAPNRVILSVQNVDIGVTGNLGGQIVVLLPIALFGIIQLNLHQVTVTVDLAVERGATGSPYVRVQSCDVQIGYADAYIENGGLIGDIVNSQFRSQISGMVKKMIPGQICQQIPTIVNEKINSKAGALPQSVALSQMLQLFGGALGLGGGGAQPSQQYCQTRCQGATALPSASVSSPAASAAPGPAPQIPTSAYGAAAPPAPAAPQAPQIPQASYQQPAAPAPPVHPAPQAAPLAPQPGYVQGGRVAARAAVVQYATGQTAGISRQLSPLATQRLRTYRAIAYSSQGNVRKVLYVPAQRAKRQAVQRQILQQVVNRQARHNAGAAPQQIYQAPPPTIQASYQQAPQQAPQQVYQQQPQPQYQQQQAPQQIYQQAPQPQAPRQLYQAPPPVYQSQQSFPAPISAGPSSVGVVGGSTALAKPGAGPRIPPPPPVIGAMAPNEPAPSCSKCPLAAQADDPASVIKQLAAHLDLSKLNDIYLGIQLIQVYATSNDFTIDLTGEFSQNAQGGTPFYPFPMSFPAAYDTHMAEFLVSDYTINSLFYHLHRKQFLSFRIGPDTPKIGELLKTTCSEDEDDLEGTDLEDEEDSTRRRRKVLSAARTFLLKRSKRGAALSKSARKHRKRRQEGDAGGGLADLGICFGDILPAVREKYPNQKIVIQLRTVRAPSVVLSQAKGGSAILDLIADAEIYIDGTNNKVGTITIAATVVIAAQVQGNRISGSAEITQLKLSDRAGTLGLPQDALDNLGNLGKELLQKLANDALGKGIVLNVPSNLGGLPLNVINPTFRIVEHGLYVASDFTVSPTLIGQLAGSGQC